MVLMIKYQLTEKFQLFVLFFRLSSRDIGQTVQPERLGIFNFIGETKHGRKIYRREGVGRQRDQFLYFWDCK